MKAGDIPLVRGGKLTPEMLAWIERVSKVFPGVEKDIVIIRPKPNREEALPLTTQSHYEHEHEHEPQNERVTYVTK